MFQMSRTALVVTPCSLASFADELQRTRVTGQARHTHRGCARSTRTASACPSAQARARARARLRRARQGYGAWTRTTHESRSLLDFEERLVKMRMAANGVSTDVCVGGTHVTAGDRAPDTSARQRGALRGHPPWCRRCPPLQTAAQTRQAPGSTAAGSARPPRRPAPRRAPVPPRRAPVRPSHCPACDRERTTHSSLVTALPQPETASPCAALHEGACASCVRAGAVARGAACWSSAPKAEDSKRGLSINAVPYAQYTRPVSSWFRLYSV